MVLHNSPPMTPFRVVPDSSFRDKGYAGSSLHAKVKIDIFHRGKGKAGIEAADFVKESSAYGEVAGPEIAADFVFNEGIRETGRGARCGDAPFKDACLRILHSCFPVGSDQIWIRYAVVIEKDQKFAGCVSGAAVSIRCRPQTGPLDNLHECAFTGQRFPGFRSVAVVADCDGALRMVPDIGNKPAQASLKHLMPVTGGNDNRNSGQSHRDIHLKIE